MELTIHVDPVERTVRFREVRALAAGDSCSVVLEGVRGADVAALRLALYRDAASDSPVASCPSFAPVRGHPNLATGDLRLDTTEMAAWFAAVRPDQAQDGAAEGRPENAAERAVRTDGWLVISEPTRTWAVCRVPVVLRPGAGVSGVVDPTSIQSLVEGLVSAAMSEALASKADKATTLAGYGITDAATKTELDAVDQRAANGIFGVQSALASKADLVDGKVPAGQLPSYVDDVLEFADKAAFPAAEQAEAGKIYVDRGTNRTYRWGGTDYVEISPSLALGETATTAYPGDKGKAAAEKADAAYSAAESLADGVNSLAGTIGTHIRDTNNPHKVMAAQVGALPISGGTLTGDLAVGEEHTASRKLTVAADNGANGITLQGGVPGTGSSITIGGSDGIGGTLTVSGGAVGSAKITVEASDIGDRGGSIEIKGTGASIKKDGKEVATEEQVNAKADKATTLAGYGITDAVPLVEDSNGEKTAVTIGTRGSGGTVGQYSIANGNNVTALGVYSHAEGYGTIASGYYSHAEGGGTTASGLCSHAEGSGTTALGEYSHAEGYVARAKDDYAYSWNGNYKTDIQYDSHGLGTFNVNPVGGLDGFYIGEKKLSEVMSDGVSDKADKTSLAPEYSPSSAYSVGAFVYHDGNIYQCTTAIADGGEAWNAAHWELRKLDDFFTESNSLLNARIAYERNVTGLKDRAFNALTFDGTEFNLSTALAAVTPTASGQPRDLLIVATATAATTISFTAGTIKGDKPTIDGSGTWIITLTEYASGVWYCRQIKMEDAA